MLKRVLVLILLLSVASAVTFEKSVSGDNVLSENEMLSVSLRLDSEQRITIRSLRDPIPPGFRAVNVPGSCAVENGVLDCKYDITIDSFSISYNLLAEESGRNIRISGANLIYLNPETDMTESVVSNDIEGEYFVGLPKVELNMTNFMVDGEPSDGSILPNGQASFILQIKNTGSIDAENVLVEISSPIISETRQLENLRPGASTSFRLSGRAPSISLFEEKEGRINVAAGWTDMGERSYPPTQSSLDFQFVRPKLSAERVLGTEWKANGELKPFVRIRINLKNEGGADADFTISQPLFDGPDLAIPEKGSIEGGAWVLREKIEEGERKSFTLLVPAERGEIEVPSLSIEYMDERGNLYERLEIEGENVEVEKTVWAMLYDAVVGPLGERVMPGALLVFLASLLLMIKTENKPVVVAFAAIALLCALIIYTWYVV